MKQRRRLGLWIVPAVLVCALAAGAGSDGPETARLEETPLRVIDAPFAQACHVQGIAMMKGRLFVSCVERRQRRALVLRYDVGEGFPNSGALAGPKVADVTRGSMYHPSGLDHDETCLWVAAANYREFRAHSRVICLDPESMEERSSFPVEDHIGTLAKMGETLVGLNWDAKVIYRFTEKGELLGRDASPTGLSYQDCKGVAETALLCSGSNRSKGAVVDLLLFDPGSGHWQAPRRYLLNAPGVAFGREGFLASDGFWFFLPEDFPKARLYVFEGMPATP